MYLNCLERAPRALGPDDTLFNQARKEELCKMGQEVASLLGLDHPELYTGLCFAKKLEPAAIDIPEEDFMVAKSHMNELEEKESA